MNFRLAPRVASSVLLSFALGACVAPDASPPTPSFLGGDEDDKADGLGSPYTATSRWSPDFESRFSDWVTQLGRARAAGECTRLADCLQSETANSLHLPEDDGLRMFADCADLPFVLRAYFSYKHRLPFSFVSEIVGEHYTAGNTPVARRSHLNFRSFAAMTRAISEQVHSGFFRMAPEVEGNDLYAIDINRTTVRPGATYYNPDGHVLVVYEVEQDGTVRFIDGHPDNSLTTNRFGSELARGSAAQGGGFHQWRLQRLSGRRFTIASNAESAGFSASAQYQSSYTVDGQTLGYHDWVRSRLNQGGALDPVKELGAQVDAVCEALRTRVTAVAAGAPMAALPHPGVLPPNIFGAEGDWEAYSTPGRDARLKAQVRNVYNLITAAVESVARGDGRYAYSGSREQLVADFKDAYAAHAGSCSLAYTSSAQTEVPLTFSDALDRLFSLSFDPYHCPELRWGARGQSELSTCPTDALKQSMYDSEQRLRNLIDREGLTETPLDLGPAVAPDLNVNHLISTL